MTTELFDNSTSNGTITSLASAIASTDSVLPVQGPASNALQQAGQSHWIIINPVDDSFEYVIVTGNGWSANWNVTRGADNSTPKNFPAGSIVKHVLTSEALLNMTNSGGGSGGNYLDVTKAPYNIKGDGGTASDGAISSTVNTSTLTTAAAARMSPGMKVYVRGAGAAGAVLNTTVASVTDATHVQLSSPALTTVASAGQVVYGTDNNAKFVLAAATGRTLFFPNPSNTFYLFDVLANGTLFLRFTQNYLKIKGESRDGAILRLGPEGATSQDNVLFQVSNTQSIVFEDITLQGQDFLGNGGPSADPGTPTGTTRNYGAVHGGTAGVIKFINCKVSKFVFGASVNATTTQAGIEAQFTHFQGYGASYRSQPLGAFEATPSAWTAIKRIWCNQCRFSDFGDPTGQNFYHAVYIYTSFAMDLEQCYFHTASTTSTGACVQHFDASVSLANASPVSRLSDCDFGPDLAGMSGVTTSYNTETLIKGGSYSLLQDSSINVAGQAIIDDVTFTAHSTLAQPLIQTGLQGQATGLTWGAQISNCRFRGSASAAGPNAIKIGRTSATSDFRIHSCDFNGFTNSSAGLILIFGSSTVVGGRMDIADCTFSGSPGYCFQAGSMSTGMRATLHGNRFYTTTGAKAIQTSGTALAYLGVKGNDFLGMVSSPADIFALAVAPTIVDIGNDNAGYVTANGGTFNQTTTGPAISFAHGLGNTSRAVTPSKVSVQPANAATAALASQPFISVGTINITITYPAAITSAPYSWIWRAEQ